MRRRMQGMFVIAGIALVVAGLNGTRPLVIVGGSLILLGLLGRRLGD